jgi:hypothetical protein
VIFKSNLHHQEAVVHEHYARGGVDLFNAASAKYMYIWLHIDGKTMERLV